MPDRLKTLLLGYKEKLKDPIKKYLSTIETAEELSRLTSGTLLGELIDHSQNPRLDKWRGKTTTELRDDVNGLIQQKQPLQKKCAPLPIMPSQGAAAAYAGPSSKDDAYPIDLNKLSRAVTGAVVHIDSNNLPRAVTGTVVPDAPEVTGRYQVPCFLHYKLEYLRLLEI